MRLHLKYGNVVRLIDRLSMSLRLHRHSIHVGYTGDGFYRLKDPTNSIKVLKEQIEYTNNRKMQ